MRHFFKQLAGLIFIWLPIVFIFYWIFLIRGPSDWITFIVFYLTSSFFWLYYNRHPEQLDDRPSGQNYLHFWE